MFFIATIAADAAAIVEPISTRASEVPELASMALLSVVLACMSVVVRRIGSKSDDRARRDATK